MKKFLLAFTFICFSIAVKAQKVFFIYLQSEKQVPFFVKMGDKVHSSTASGYLILSSLKDSVYLFTIGYPGTQSGETKFSVTINNNDKGFLIKNFDDGPGLFDLQSLSISKPVASGLKTGGQQTVIRTDAFTKLLSQATDDASLLIQTIAPVVVIAQTEIADDEKKEAVETVAEIKSDKGQEINADKPVEIKTDKFIESTNRPATNDEVLATKIGDSAEPQTTKIEKVLDSVEVIEPDIIEETQAEIKQDVQEITKNEIISKPYQRSVVTRRSESSTTEGFGLVFIDDQTGEKDTIRLLIPNPKKAFKEEEDIVKEISSENNIREEKKPVSLEQASQPNKQKNSCNNFASDKDFLKLRKNMAAETNDEQMIAEAKKYFRNKCFTTEQIRNLSGLFLTSASKYQFFDAAFAHVSDSKEFSNLGLEIKDEYYSKRFKALVGE
jgi:hypothetical protein